MFYCRKSPRIPNFDYASTQYYFITICTHEKQCIFGTADALSQMGKIAQDDFLQLMNYYENVHVDNFIVMPNHVHAIIAIEATEQKSGRTTLSSIVGAYKAGVSRKINQFAPDIQVWQRSFHDHVIRGREDYEKIWNYVQYNMQKWKDDCFYAE